MAFLEAIPAIGTFVPGSTVLLGISAVAVTGELSLSVVFAAAVGGAVLGDGSAYWIGRRYPGSVREIWPMKGHPKLVLRSKRFFERYGAVSILFARFVPPIRAFVPITAGAMGMAPSRFYPINICAIALWATAYVLPGIFAGSLYRRAGEFEGYILPVFLGSCILGGLVWIIWRSRKKIPRDAD